MALGNKIKRQERKDERAAKRMDRQDVREARKVAKAGVKDYKLEKGITGEMQKAGVDKSYTAPMTEGAKKRITEGLTVGAGKDLLKKAEGFASAYGGPKYKDQTALDKEQLKESLRKQRRARWWDALYAFGEGLRGGTADQRFMRSRQLKGERQAQYQQYKDVAEANRATAQQWEEGYRQNLLKFLEGERDKLTDSEMDQLKKRKYNAEINRIKAMTPKPGEDGKFAPEEDDPYLKGSNPFTTRLASLVEDVDLVMPVTGDEMLNPSEKEAQAKEIIMQMYDIKTDQKGNQYLEPKPGMENYITELAKQREQERKLVPIDKELKLAKMDLEHMGDEGTAAWEWKDKQKRKELEAKIAELEQQKKDILKEDTPSSLDAIYNQ